MKQNLVSLDVTTCQANSESCIQCIALQYYTLHYLDNLAPIFSLSMPSLLSDT